MGHIQWCAQIMVKWKNNGDGKRALRLFGYSTYSWISTIKIFKNMQQEENILKNKNCQIQWSLLNMPMEFFFKRYLGIHGA